MKAPNAQMHTATVRVYPPEITAAEAEARMVELAHTVGRILRQEELRELSHDPEEMGDVQS